MKVLYVEDAQFLATAVKSNLEKQGISTDLAFDGRDGLDKALKNIYDCVILDIMLPKMSGTDILKRMRAKNVTTPVIMLSALHEVESKVANLDNGADDYLAKPFKTVELVARIKALLRRPPVKKYSKLVFSDLTFDETSMTLNGEQLTAKESKIIVELLRTPEAIVNKEYLLAKVWGDDGAGEANYIETYVSRIRKILKKVKSNVNIKAVRGLGYKITEK